MARRRGRWTYGAVPADGPGPPSEAPTPGFVAPRSAAPAASGSAENRPAVPTPPAVVPPTPPPPPTEVTVVTPGAEFDRAVPPGLQVAAAWSWRVLLVVAVIFGLGWLARYLSEVMVPVAIAILLAALLSPVANRLRSWGLPRGAATAGTVLGGLALIAGSLVLIGTQIAVQASTLSGNVVQGFYQLLDYLRNGPIPISDTWLNSDEWVDPHLGLPAGEPEPDRRVRHRHRRGRRPFPGRLRDRPLHPVLLPLRRPRHLHVSVELRAPGQPAADRRGRAEGLALAVVLHAGHHPGRGRRRASGY